jgi:cytochrome c7-like protein
MSGGASPRMSRPVSVFSCWIVALVAIFVACQKDTAPPRFPHKLHLAGVACGGPGQPACLSCASCHALSEQAAAHRMPAQSLCDTCHSEGTHQEKVVLPIPPPRPYGEIGIDHDQHLALPSIQGQCVPCHAGVFDKNRPNIPPMSQCFGCHEHQEQWDRGECSPCHQQQDLKRTLPVTFLKHDPAFMRQHGGVVAQKQQALLCQSCHTQNDCQACHDLSQNMTIEQRRPERIETRQVHRGDFMVRHAIEARSESAKCASCHTPQTCDSCHAARGVSANVMNARNPHPPEWVGTNTQSSNFHGPAARRDIVACAGCHEAGPQTNCIRCHTVGAYGGNPHPQGWKSNRGRDSQMCRYCHGT